LDIYSGRSIPAYCGYGNPHGINNKAVYKDKALTEATGEKWRVITPILLSFVSIMTTVNVFVLNGIKDNINDNKNEIKEERVARGALAFQFQQHLQDYSSLYSSFKYLDKRVNNHQTKGKGLHED
jgi:hypothetical protein